MTLTKAELANLLFLEVGLNKLEAKNMVESFMKRFLLHCEAERASSFQVLVISSYV